MKNDIQCKSALIQIRATAEMARAVKKRCRQRGITVSGWFRWAWKKLEGGSNDTPEKTLKEMWWEE